MKPISRLFSFSAPALLVGALVGCASGASKHDSHSHSMMELKEMCAMHKQMMAAKTPAEQQAMMKEHMESKSPEMQKHMQMLQQCK